MTVKWQNEALLDKKFLNNKFFIPNTVQDGMQQYSFSILNNSSTIHMLQVTIDAFSMTPQVCQILYLGIWERMKEGHASKISDWMLSTPEKSKCYGGEKVLLLDHLLIYCLGNILIVA